jgi:hypothetical protein
MSDDKYRPRQLDEIEGNDVSLINEPVRREGALTHARWWSTHSLRAILAENLANAELLLDRLQAGVHVPTDVCRADYEATIRQLYLRSHDQIRVLQDALALEGLE